MFLRLACSTIAFAAALTVVSAQQPQPGMPVPGAPVPGVPPGQPTRMPPRAARPGEDPAKGTSVLRGYVTAADTGDPVRRALVRASSSDGRGTGMATTDADGRFEIRDLPGGRYTITVSKAGYVTMSYGQRRPEQQGTVLEVLDGQLVEKIAFALPRGGVITGTVLDEFGDPIAGADVRALRSRYVSGARRLVPTGMAQTDDRGIFRIYGLAPGDYYVTGSLRSQPGMMMSPGNVSVGAVDGYAPTYYPGTPNPGEASRITVRAMQEASNITFSLISARLSRVSGRVVTSAGAPVVQGMVMLMPADRFSGAMGFNTGMTRADGSFQIVGVAPGTYNLQVRPRGMPTPDAEFANMRIVVGQDDVDNVTLVTSRGAIARGIVTTDEGTVLPVRPEQVRIFLQPADLDSGFMMMPGDSSVRDDWTFEISGLSEGRRFTATVADGPEWTLKAVLHNGVDITDTGFEFVPGQLVEGFEVVFTRKRTEISGQITGERNAPATDATVIVFAEDPARWGYASRYVRIARPNQDGRYNVRGLPPNDYLAVAVKEVEPGQWQDPEFLESLRPYALRLSLNESDTKVQDLRVITPGS